MGRSRLEIVGVVEGAWAGHEDGRPTWVEYGMSDWKRGDVESLCVRVRETINLKASEVRHMREKRTRGRGIGNVRGKAANACLRLQLGGRGFVGRGGTGRI